MTRLLVCGGRDFKDKETLKRAMKKLHPTTVITGAARGADTLADEIAESEGIPRIIFPANWSGEGKAAGHIRNARMLSEGKPDYTLACPGGSGTKSMVDKSLKAGTPVIFLKDEEHD